MTGGRCIAIRYRLAPQNPFPAALLNTLVSYLHLVDRPPGSLHEAITTFNLIVLGGTSGAWLCLSLVQLILNLNHHTASPLTAQNVSLKLPAGLATFSAW